MIKGYEWNQKESLPSLGRMLEGDKSRIHICNPAAID